MLVLRQCLNLRGLIVYSGGTTATEAGTLSTSGSFHHVREAQQAHSNHEAWKQYYIISQGQDNEVTIGLK